jgi:hypothetical protein
MKIWDAFPTLRLELGKRLNKSEDLRLEIVHYTEKHHKRWSLLTVGFFIKQPDGTFNFEYKNEERKKMFAEILMSEEAVKTFWKHHDKISGGKK